MSPSITADWVGGMTDNTVLADLQSLVGADVALAPTDTLLDKHTRDFCVTGSRDVGVQAFVFPRSTEQVSLQQGKAKKTDLGWRAGGGGFFGAFAAAGASSYANTEIGQVVTAAYLDAFIKMVEDVKQLEPDAKADNVQQAVSMARAGKLLSGPNNSSEALRELDAGAMLYPTGEKQGPFWKVMDDLGNEGWVAMGLLELAK